MKDKLIAFFSYIKEIFTSISWYALGCSVYLLMLLILYVLVGILCLVDKIFGKEGVVFIIVGLPISVFLLLTIKVLIDPIPDLIRTLLNPEITSTFKELKKNHSFALKEWAEQNKHVLSKDYTESNGETVLFKDKKTIFFHKEDILKMENEKQLPQMHFISAFKKANEKKSFKQSRYIQKAKRIFDPILSLLNPQIIASYNNLEEKHNKALLRWKKQNKSILSEEVNNNPSFKDKRIAVENIKNILEVEETIAKEEESARIRKIVLEKANKYPHAFNSLLSKIYPKSSLVLATNLPGERVSKRNGGSGINLEKKGFINDLDTKVNNKSLRHISSQEFEILYSKLYLISDYEEKEKFIVRNLQEEDIRILFDDEIEENKMRSKYFVEFVQQKCGIADEEVHECFGFIIEQSVWYLDELDEYILSALRKQYERIKASYPLGTDTFEEMNCVSMDYFEKHGIVVENEQRIQQLEGFAKENIFYNELEESQNKFKSLCRNIHNEAFDSWGCYCYNVPFCKTQKDGNTTNGTYTVWQHFYMGFSEDDSLDLSYLPHYGKNKSQLIPRIESDSYFFQDSVIDHIVSFVEKICENKRDKNVSVYLANSFNLSDEVLFHNFSYLENELCHLDINICLLEKSKISLDDSTCCIIVDLITTNEQLKKNCSFIIEKFRDSHKNLVNIAYVSLLKGFDKGEMEKLIERKREEERKRREEAERRRREEEERRRREEEINATIIKAKSIASNYASSFIKIFPNVNFETITYEQAQSIVNSENKIKDDYELVPRLRNAVSCWGYVKGIPYYHFFHYYPTNRFSNVSQESEAARHLIWNFKDGTINARDLVVNFMKKKLTNTFSLDDLRKITFVCIPASTTESNNNRFRMFASRLCSETGMMNGFSHISLARDREASHLGGTDSAEYKFDADFFKGAYVILFDDVVTRGRSMSQMQQLLSQYGATVICAMSIGHTYSDYYGDNRTPHPWTGNL